jgi:hypothetical protein
MRSDRACRRLADPPAPDPHAVWRRSGLADLLQPVETVIKTDQGDVPYGSD